MCLERELELSPPSIGLNGHGHGDALDERVHTGESNVQPAFATDHSSRPLLQNHLNGVLIDEVCFVTLETERVL